MPDYHSTPTFELADLQSFAALQAFVARRPATEMFEDYERELGACMRRIECELTARELARYDVDADLILVEGVEYRRCLKHEPKEYGTASGPVIVPRNLFRPAGGGKSICPLELRAGLIGACTPVLARQVTFLMGQVTSAEAAAVFTEMGIAGPSASTCDRVPKLISPVWEQHREQWEAALRATEEVPCEAGVLAVSLDGVLVPDRAAQREAKATREAAAQQGLSPQASGPAGYREVGCGTVSLYAPSADPTSKDPDARRPQRLDTVRYARAPEHKKKTLTAQLDAEVDAMLAVRPDLQLAALADGADENWRYFAGPKWANATKIVDHGHASQHLKAGLATYYGDTVDGRAEYERLRLLLRDKDGGADEVLAALDRLHRKLTGHPRRRKLLKKERTYFRNQRGRMDYARYQRLGLPIGSGVVEAACKTLAAQRLKRSGMNWGDGKQPILTIRSLQQSNRWERGWRLLADSFRHPTTTVTCYGTLRCLSLAQEAA
jgi:hypothetical protein